MRTLERRSWRERSRASPVRLVALAAAALLLGAVWLIPLSVAWHGLLDPVATYRASGLEAASPWAAFEPQDQATSVRVIQALAVAVGLVGLVGLVGTGGLVLAGRVSTVLGAIVAAATVLVAAVYLRGYGFWTAWSLLAGVLAWLAGTVVALTGALPAPEERHAGARRPKAL